MSNFLKLKSQFQSITEVRSFLQLKEHSWRDVGYGFDALRVPRYIIRDKVVNEIITKFQLTPNILRTPANFWYKWHLDKDRSAAINIELYTEHSHTVYGSDAEHGNKNNIEELVYEEAGMYLLNTQLSHSVLNLGGPRYVLTLGFKYPDTYELVKDFCISNNY